MSSVSWKPRIQSGRTLRRLAQVIARRFHPVRIILFGSYAYGRPTVDSDVDLLVIVRRGIDPALISCALPDSVALDILVRTEGEVRERLALHDPFISEIVARGRVLYDAPRQRVG